MTRVLLTGAAGFLGAHVTNYLLKTTDWAIIGLTRLSHSGNLNRLAQMPAWASEGHRVGLVHHDLRSPISAQLAEQIGCVDTVIALGASTHVDRSIADPMSFVLDNVVAICNLLEFARQIRPQKMLYFGTDEVHGPAPDAVAYKEWDRYHSGNVYAATKAGAEELCLSYQNTYGLPILITHCQNIIGEYQHPEKFVPMCIRKILVGEEVIIHADPTCTIPGSRFYIHARNVAHALFFLLEHGEVGEKFNIVGPDEVNNLQLAQMIAQLMDRELSYALVNWHESRPGHDLRYALSGEKMKNMGWKPPMTFDASLRSVVKWYQEHPEWL